MKITNCHIHIFNSDYIPNNFVPVVGGLVKYKPFRLPLRFILKALNPFSSRDKPERFARFMKVSYKESQESIYKIIRGYYPPGTRFIVLAMDMQFMKAGKINKSWDQQNKELAELAVKYSPEIIPFLAADPRRENLVEKIKELVEKHNFRGIKIYPPLGFFPSDERLYPVYEYAQEKGIPIMAHCSRGGIYDRREVKKENLIHPDFKTVLEKKDKDKFSDYYADPNNYKKVMQDFPELRICLGHFGGEQDWEDYLYNHWDAAKGLEMSWLSKIMDMIKSGDYPNLYSDISFTIMKDEHYMHVLKVLLSDERVLNRTLFGSDFYMVEKEQMEERKLIMKMRSILGEEFFGTIVEKNPASYLGETS